MAGKKEKKNERKQNHIASPTGIANNDIISIPALFIATTRLLLQCV